MVSKGLLCFWLPLATVATPLAFVVATTKPAGIAAISRTGPLPGIVIDEEVTVDRGIGAFGSFMKGLSNALFVLLLLFFFSVVPCVDVDVVVVVEVDEKLLTG